MFRRLLLSCAVGAASFACNGEEPAEGEPGEGEPGAYEQALDRYWAMCVENGEGAEPVLEADDPGVFEIVDLWHGDVIGADRTPFVVTVGRLHPLPLEAAYLEVRAYPIGGEGIELLPMQPADHRADDSPVPPNVRSEPVAHPLSDIERRVYGICEAALLRGERVVHDSGSYRVQIDLLFEDDDGNRLRLGDVVDMVAE